MNNNMLTYSLWTQYNNFSFESLFFALTGKICSFYAYKNINFKKAQLIQELKQEYSGNTDFQFILNQSNTNFLEAEIDESICIVLTKTLIVNIYFGIQIYYLYKNENNELQQLKALIEKFLDNEDKKGWFHIIENDINGFDLTKHKADNVNMNISQHYNEDFLLVHETINNFLRTEKSGLIILHGKQGAGKTSYIRHLINGSDKKFIYLPSQLMHEITNPNFISFLTKYSGSIIILEDCEELLKPRQTQNYLNPSIVNILNITDGILGDVLKMKIICTFNTQLSNIDKALLRKGRLAARYEFKELSIEKANRIITEQNLNIPFVNIPITLADLFNSTDDSYELQNEGLIGFNK